MPILSYKRYSIHIGISIFIFLLTFSVFINTLPTHASSNLTIIPSNSSVFGKPFSEWTAEWWKWYIETPFDSNHQSKDLTGANCARSQTGPVWFLSGSEKVPIEKTCIIPGGKAILFPILIVECSYVEFKNEKTPAGLLKCAKSLTDSMQNLKAIYNGKEIPAQQIRQEFRVTTSPFIVNFPAKNVFSAEPAGPSTAISDGYWVMFKAPPPGNYDIKFGGCFGNPLVVDPAKFCQDVTYHLKVLPS
jgi:hypothetical protein